MEHFHNTFEAVPGFCPKCGSILPLLKATGGISCYNCKENYGPEGNSFIDFKNILNLIHLKIIFIIQTFRSFCLCIYR